jgi:hypothetical protein
MARSWLLDFFPFVFRSSVPGSSGGNDAGNTKVASRLWTGEGLKGIIECVHVMLHKVSVSVSSAIGEREREREKRGEKWEWREMEGKRERGREKERWIESERWPRVTERKTARSKPYDR